MILGICAMLCFNKKNFEDCTNTFSIVGLKTLGILNEIGYFFVSLDNIELSLTYNASPFDKSFTLIINKQ